MHKFVQHPTHGEGDRGGGPYIFPIQQQKVHLVFRKVLDCCHECISTCWREEFIRNSFLMSSQVKIELGERE